jgi:hypothetical protein
MMNKRGNHEHVAPKEGRGCFLCPQNGEEVVPTLETYFAKPQQAQSLDPGPISRRGDFHGHGQGDTSLTTRRGSPA